MVLPNAHLARIDAWKLTDYLLSVTHSTGSSKARWLRSVGFDEANVAQLESGLRKLIMAQEIIQHTSLAFVRHSEGNAFEVEFVTAEGSTIAVLTLENRDIRPFAGDEILHARAV